MTEEWRINPPAALLLKWRFGYKPPEPEAVRDAGAMNPADFLAWVKSTGGRALGPG